MTKISPHHLWSWILGLITSWASSVIFYTIIPLPSQWTNNWSRIARWCPIVGLFLGLFLGLVNTLLGVACQL